jgi:hypothetical protein
MLRKASPDDRLRSQAFFPFVSLRRDPRGRTPLVTLSEKVHIALLHVQTEGSRVLYREDVEALGIDPGCAYLSARERLARLVRARLVTVRSVRGPWNAKCLAFSHSFLAASCLVMPNLFEMARASLGVERMCIAVPRRDLLVVLPDLGQPFRAAVRDLLGSRGVPPENTALFGLEPCGPGYLRSPSQPPRPAASSLAHIDLPTEEDEVVDVVLDNEEVTTEVCVSEALAAEDRSVRRISRVVPRAVPPPLPSRARARSAVDAIGVPVTTPTARMAAAR